MQPAKPPPPESAGLTAVGDAATQTVLLRHDLPDGRGFHYDWMIARPGEDRLWTARTQQANSDWKRPGAWTLHELPPHRRDYLTYEGGVSGGRGTVRRIDAGTVRIERWSNDEALLSVAMAQFRGTIRLTRVDATTWRAESA